MDNIDNKTNEVVNPSDKKKRGRKKNSVIVSANNDDHDNQDDQDSLIATENTKEKKPRKKRTKKGESSSNSIVKTDANIDINVSEDTPTSLIKKRKRRTRKDIENAQIANTNIIVSSTNDTNDNNTDNQTDEVKEEKVAKKRGRKPKGGKITIQTQSNSHIQNELPNIILHLKCSLSDLNKNNIEVNETFDTINNNGACNNNIATSSNTISNNNNTETIQSYNSTNAIGSEINNNIDRGNNDNSGTGINITLYHRDLLMNNTKNSHSHSHSQTITNVHNMITKDDSHTKDSSLNETYSSAMFQVYDPCIAVEPQPDSCNMSYYRNSNEIINKNPASLFSTN